MKRLFKLLVICILLAGSSASRAQYADMYYHRVGDTIEWRSPIGYYSWWEFEYFYEHALPTRVSVVNSFPWFEGYAYDSIIVLQKFSTPVPLRIVGVAGSPYQGNQNNFTMSPAVGNTQEYFYVYQSTPDSLVRVAEAPWNLLDSHRTLHVVTHFNGGWGSWNWDSCCIYNPVDEYIPIYEYYFDSVVTVTGDFYVGGSIYSNGFTDPDTYPTQVMTGYRSAYSYNGGAPGCDPVHLTPDCFPTNFSIARKVHYPEWAMDEWWPWEFYDDETNIHHCSPGIIYPLIEVDTTMPPADMCPDVSGLEVMLQDSLCAMVTWDGFPNYTGVTLTYGSLSEPPSTWTTVEVHDSTFYRICGLATAGMYGVKIKAMCEKKETAWSNPVYIYSPGAPDDPNPDDSTSAVPSALSACTFLAPNPAHGTVTVSSSFYLQDIDIYNARGILVVNDHAVGHRHEVSLEGLPAGPYVVAIHTSNGTTHKKLVIR